MQKSDRVMVVGGGTMGTGIAQAFLESGQEVCVLEVDDESVLSALSTVKAGIFDGLHYRHKDFSVSEITALAQKLYLSLEGHTWSGLTKDRAEPMLVIETVFEDLGVKSQLLVDLQKRYPSCEFFATNTSSISIDAIGTLLPRPECLVGMHFFNPVSRSSLIEIVKGRSTSRKTLEMASDVARSLGREAIVVKDTPGFATSRLGVLMGIEAIRMLEEGVASASDIDKGMMLGYKLPVGPLRLTDMVGLDVRLAIAKYLEGTLGERFKPPRLLIDKVARGELGKKSGAGFFEWPS